MLGNESFRSRYRPRAEIVVACSGNALETLRRPDHPLPAAFADLKRRAK